MRILYVSNVLSYGGASKLINDILPLIKQRGHYCEVLILTDDRPKYIDSIRDKGISVTVISQKVTGKHKIFGFLKEFIKSGNYDIVHANLFPAIYYCSLAARSLGKAGPFFVMTEHNTDNRRRHIPVLKPLENFMYKPYNTIISISAKTQSNLCAWLRPDAKWQRSFVTIENGIPLETFKSANGYNPLKLCKSFVPGDVLLAMVGSFTDQKNHGFMMKVMKKLPTNYKILLLGEGALQQTISEEAIQMGISNRVSFLGFRTDVAEIMHTANIIVIPSKWEGFGLIAAEAMATGTPIVASAVPGLSEVIGDAGIKVALDDVDAFANAIQALTDNAYYSTLSEKGKLRSERFDIEKTVDEYLSVYERLCKQKIEENQN